jgi:hypothetical protein
MNASSASEDVSYQPTLQRASWLAWLRPRFSLRMLLAAMFLFAALLGVYARLQARANRQRAIVTEAAKVGGYVRYDFECWSESPWYAVQRWLAPRTGPDLVGNVLILNFEDRGSEHEWTKALLKAIELQRIQYLSASRPDLSPTQVRHLSRLNALTQLGLNDVAELPDLSSFAALAHLDKLSLHSCRGVTAEKLHALRNLPRLLLVDVCCTDANDDVARELSNFVELEEVHVEFSSITHGGLIELAKSNSLRVVHVSREQAAHGIAELAPRITFAVK